MKGDDVQTETKKRNGKMPTGRPVTGPQAMARTAREPEVLGDEESLPVPGAAVEGLDAITRGEIDIQIATARRYPRDVAKAMQNAIKLATYDEEIAEACFYSLPRGGKRIEGPSIRLAEILASCWGNLRYGSRMLEEGDRFVTALGFAHDLETNTAFAGAVQRRITNKSGSRYDDDMIGVTANAAQAIAQRNAIGKVVPRVYLERILRQVKAVAVGDASTFASRRDRVIERYGKMGVAVEQVLARVERSDVESITGEDLELLIGLGTAVKEGMISIDDAFGTPAAGEAEADATKGTAGLKDLLKRAAASKEPPHDPKTGEIKEEPAKSSEPTPATAGSAS